MPLYEYRCPKCGLRFERIQKFSDPDPKKCPDCGARGVERLLHAPAVQFKGSGWYVTDYARTGNSGQKTSQEKPAENGAGKSDKVESKPKADRPQKSRDKGR